ARTAADPNGKDELYAEPTPHVAAASVPGQRLRETGHRLSRGSLSHAKLRVSSGDSQLGAAVSGLTLSQTTYSRSNRRFARAALPGRGGSGRNSPRTESFHRSLSSIPPH